MVNGKVCNIGLNLLFMAVLTRILGNRNRNFVSPEATYVFQNLLERRDRRVVEEMSD